MAVVVGLTGADSGWDWRGKGLFCLSNTQRCSIAPQSLCTGFWMLLWLVRLAPEWNPKFSPGPFSHTAPEDHVDKKTIVVRSVNFLQQSRAFAEVSFAINKCNSKYFRKENTKHKRRIWDVNYTTCQVGGSWYDLSIKSKSLMTTCTHHFTCKLQSLRYQLDWEWVRVTFFWGHRFLYVSVFLSL